MPAGATWSRLSLSPDIPLVTGAVEGLLFVKLIITTAKSSCSKKIKRKLSNEGVRCEDNIEEGQMKSKLKYLIIHCI